MRMHTIFMLLYATSASPAATDSSIREINPKDFLTLYVPTTISFADGSIKGITIGHPKDICAFQLLFIAFNNTNIRKSFLNSHSSQMSKSLSADAALRTFYDTLPVDSVKQYPHINFFLALFTFFKTGWRAELKLPTNEITLQEAYFIDQKTHRHLPELICLQLNTLTYDYYSRESAIQSLLARTKDRTISREAAHRLWEKSCSKREALGIKIETQKIKAAFRRTSDAPDCPKECTLL